LSVSGALAPFFNGSNRGVCFAWSRGELRAIVMFDSNDDAQGDYRGVAVSTGSVRRRRWSAAEKAAVIRETLVPGARISDVARRWQVDPQQVYRWRHRDGVTHRAPIRRNDAAEPAFVPIITDAMPADAAAPATLATPVIEVRLAGAVVRVVSGLDDAQLTAVLRAVRASALCA
jgi:transposase